MKVWATITSALLIGMSLSAPAAAQSGDGWTQLFDGKGMPDLESVGPGANWRVENGELFPNVSYNKNLIALGDREPNVSARNDIVVDETEEGTYVLFLTTRGLKHYFTGFLRVPPGGDPNKFFEFEDKPPSQLVRYDTDWYFVAN